MNAPTTQPKLTALLDVCEAAIDIEEYGIVRENLRAARTAVAGIIAERDRALRAIERKDAAMRKLFPDNGHLYCDFMLPPWLIKVIQDAIAYTGIEE